MFPSIILCTHICKCYATILINFTTIHVGYMYMYMYMYTLKSTRTGLSQHLIIQGGPLKFVSRHICPLPPLPLEQSPEYCKLIIRFRCQ